MKTQSWPSISFHCIACLLASLAACDAPGITLVRPPTSGSEGFTIHVTLEDSALASALGWQDGVPGAEVQMHRIIDPFQPRVVHTDSTGRTLVRGLLSGLYKVATYRMLSQQEAAATGGVIRAFGDGVKLRLPVHSGIQLTLDKDRRESLVFSEFYGGGQSFTLDLHYRFDLFIELYNNSDTTVYLDGMLIGQAFGYGGSAVNTCAENELFREDPLGLWSSWMHQFPGTGTDYPVGPGEPVIVALDAVDHSQVHPSLPDLANADFEFQGTADTDNPDVPNMPSVGTRTYAEGHGINFYQGSQLYLSLPVDVANLDQRVHPTSGYTYARVPTDRIADVIHGTYEDPNSGALLVPQYYCPRWVNRSLERLEYVFYKPGGNADNTKSIHRKVLRIASSGRIILQDINTSRVDFLIGDYSPGRIEY
jgi:hypothetical protein